MVALVHTKLKEILNNYSKYKFLNLHCNQGMSRSPGIGLLYLAKEEIIKNDSFQEALTEFEKIYPGINMAGGMRGFLEGNWDEYMK